MTPELEKALLTLANKLGVTVEHLWAVMIYQARITAIVDAVIFTGCVLFVVLPGRYLWRRWQSEGADADDFILVIGSAAYAVGALFAIIMAVSAFSEMVTALFNPEYWALSQILSASK